MIPDEPTCWTIIHAAGQGDQTARAEFARLYEPVARAYFTARWRGSHALGSLDDAVQEVFVECFKFDGVLAKAQERESGGFRGFFHGVLKNLARRQESSRSVAQPLPVDRAADDPSLAAAFDKAWARSLLKEAARVQAETAAKTDERAVRRVELLRLRFHDGLSIRDIALMWKEDAARLHHEYATARDEFRAALHRVIAFQNPHATRAELDIACRELLALM